MASIKDVARRAGVSISTVSNVLSGKKYVSGTLSKRVMAAVEELDYQADPIAQILKTNRSHTVGVIATEIGGLFFPSVLRGLYTVLNKNGYNLQVFETDGTRDPENSWKRMLEGVRNFVDYRVDGIVLTTVFPAELEEYYINRILKMIDGERKIALVSLNEDYTRFGIDSVFENHYAGAEKAVNHLIQKGCTKIAHITGPIYTQVSSDRLNAYRDTVLQAGLQLNEDQIASGDYTHQSGYRAMKEIIRRAPDFDGLFSANDQMCIGAMLALREAGYKIPEDVKVIGYDDLFISAMLEPPLSTIHIPKHSLGERGGELLIKRMQEDDGQEHKATVLELETRLIERKSTSLDSSGNWALSDW